MSFSLSAKAQYACLAMLELAIRDEEDRPLALREIATRHGIPQPFLVQILQQLKQAGIVTSTRGSQGGYRLSPGSIDLTLLEICEAIGCGETECGLDANRTPEAIALRTALDEAGKAFRDALGGVRLGELARDCPRNAAAMFYI